jgi:hypothetical protein
MDDFADLDRKIIELGRAIALNPKDVISNEAVFMAKNMNTTKRSPILIERFRWLQMLRAYITIEVWPGIKK